MSYSTMCCLPQPHSEVAAMRIKQAVPAKALALARKPPVSLSRQARQRLKWMDHYRANGNNASKTCRHFDISRSTFYLWKKRYNPKDLTSLEDKSSRPHKVRQRTWSAQVVQALKRHREQHPRCLLRRLFEGQGQVAGADRAGGHYGLGLDGGAHSRPSEAHWPTGGTPGPTGAGLEEAASAALRPA